MKPLIVANWKMNPQTLREGKLLFNLVKRGIKNIRKVEVVICPPFVYLATSDKQQATKIKLGAQNCFWEEKGAFTGEISPKQLSNLGCQYAIIGHSERRRYFQETDEIINKKIKAAFGAKMTPILCVGETKKEKEEGKVQQVLSNQLKLSLKKISGYKLQTSRLCIAYEPIWAIGTGRPCDVNTTQIMGLLIKKIISQIYNRNIAKNIRVLYGGSVNSKNALSFTKEARMGGLLVGGASLDSQEFIRIIKNISKEI